MVVPRSDSYPAVMPSAAPRRSTSVQLTLAKSAPVSVQPPKLTRSSVAPPNSASRSRQSSNLVSVRVALRKFTESSLQSRNVTRRIEAEKACTPASAQPVSVTSCQPVSARSQATNLVSRSWVSVNRAFRSRAPSNVVLTNEQSRKWQLPAWVPANEAPSNCSPSYSSSGSRAPSYGVRSAAMGLTLPAQVGQHRQHPAVVFRRGEQTELGEHVPDVGPRSWAT
jgi:hypothetical protein